MRPLALIAALALTGCGYYRAPDASVCIADTGLTSQTLTCGPMQQHEVIADAAFKRAQPTANNVSGWTVIVRTDVEWSEKYQRFYFTDASAPGWLLWGLTDFDNGVISLADSNLARAVLAHEECHVRYPPPYTHLDWTRLGCDQVERAVSEALTQASGVYEGDNSHGVYDPAESGFITGASGGER